MHRDDPAALRPIGSHLAAIGYDEISVASALGLTRMSDWRPADIPVYERRLGDHDPLAVCVRLFLLGRATPRAALEAVLPAAAVDTLCAHDLVAVDGSTLHPLVRLTPFAGFIVAHDPDRPETPAADHVLGIGPASRLLHALTVRPDVERALDIGTGCGVQALALARHARYVVATDVNSRALRLAALNAALNGIDNVEVRAGSLLEPVAGETFDLVVANPPFVLSPDTTFVFRDAGLAGNVSQHLVTALPAVLRPGGFAQMLINWEVAGEGDAWEETPRTWLHGTSCDGWLLASPAEDGLTYAATWNRWLRETDPSAFAAALDRWTSYYAQHGIRAVAFGALTLRRRASGVPWWRTERPVDVPGLQAGEQVRQVFALQDRMRAASDAALLAMTPRLVGPHRLDQTLRYRDGAYVVDGVWVRVEGGAGVRAAVEPQALLVLLAIDGHQTLGQLLEEARAGLSAAEGEHLEGAVVRTVRRLAGLGMLALNGDDA